MALAHTNRQLHSETISLYKAAYADLHQRRIDIKTRRETRAQHEREVEAAMREIEHILEKRRVAAELATQVIEIRQNIEEMKRHGRAGVVVGKMLGWALSFVLLGIEMLR